MLTWLIPVILVSVLLLAAVTATLVCFFMIFYSPKGLQKQKDQYPTPGGKVYDPYRAQMIAWIKEAQMLPHTNHSILSHDGLCLRGSYYEFKKGAPVEIMFHGYKGNAIRDLSGGIFRCQALGHNVLIVDHRASGKSEGRIITFGAKESLDCVAWANYYVKEIDPNAEIILTGISMGAATVLTAASMPLPPQVVGILADCGYTSTEDIVKKVMRDMKLPASLLYPFARLSAILIGRFDPNKTSPIESMKQCSLPVIFFHGDTDDFVPCFMSERNFEACTSERKRMVVTPSAGHGLCFPVDQDTYIREMRDFFDQ